ncbi:uncharacterized protein LOC131597510 [Vicia villosa]|uniref:uncharacterized protein LOC131597510 n=1 Tax=Vicia villosa TaxID=3911 RepID=UPI00273CBB11|nr:uncharacterized protein LOC131597510 [Vicia villosa]
MMLTHVKGPKSYDEIKTVNNVKYDTFRDACFAMGFIGDDREIISAMTEAFHWGSGHYLRLLFIHMLLSSSINRPKHVWSKTRHLLSDGILYSQQRIANNRGLRLTNEEILNLTLVEIEKLLRRSRKSLSDFPGMPKPQDEQRDVFKQILTAVDTQNGGVFFLYGYGGTGKTYMWRTLASYIRSRRKICLTVSSSGIASLLLPGGRTTHSKFKIPIPTHESSTCDINKGSDSGDLLKVSKLIIWDEAPMCHKFCFEALDKTLRDIMGGSRSSDEIFGDKVIVFGGDFRQILPVIPRGGRSDIIHATINSSYIWVHFKSRAILAGTIETVDEINHYVLDNLPGDEKEYLSSDSLDTHDGLPNHKIILKVNTPIMLLRNIDQAEGLCNGTRLIVTRLADHVIEAKIISGKNIGGIIYIARMDITPTQSPWPFRMTRRQFPITVCYAMTINKSQGQSLDHVGIYLLRSVFSHGQFYVAVSRVKSRKGLKILIHDKDKHPLTTTTNVVFKEVFENL